MGRGGLRSTAAKLTVPHVAARSGQQEAYALVLGVTLRALRLEHRLSQSEVAQRAGLAQCMQSRVERGRADLTLYQLRRLALVFSMQPAALCALVERVFTRAGHHAAAATGSEAAWWDAVLEKSPEGIRAVALLAQEKSSRTAPDH